MRHLFGRAAQIIAFFAAMEAIFFASGLLSMQRGNPYLLYAPWRLSAAVADILPSEREASLTGWPRQGEFPTRPHPEETGPPCASAWGGSFTVGDDVSDSEAWPHRLSLALGCQVDNHGVDGFAVDQTLLHYRAHAPKDSIVLFGLSEPMIIGDGIASWTFVSLAPDLSPKVSLTKPRFDINGEKPVLTSRPPADTKAIYRYITDDMAAADWTALTFPYTASVTQAIYRKFHRQSSFNESSAAADRSDMAALRRLGYALVAEMARSAAAGANRFVLVLLPSPDLRGALGAALAQMAQSLHDSGVCVADPTTELTELGRQGNFRTTTGHLNAAGNQAVADAVARAMRACGIKT
jgi:hypothetical protein